MAEELLQGESLAADEVKTAAGKRRRAPVMKRVRACVLVAGLVGLLAGVEADAQIPAAAPQRLSRDWKRLRLIDLEVVGNASEKDLRRAADAITSFRGTLKALLPGIQISSPEPTRLIVFRDYRAFEPFTLRDGQGRRLTGVGGYFSSHPTANELVMPAFEGTATLQVAFHEYTHFLINRNLQRVPLWLNEGLADFYSTFELKDDRTVLIGRAPEGRAYTVSSRALPPLSDLLSGQSSLRLFQGADTEMFYAQSWLFVHYMTLGNGGKRQGQIWKYLELLQTATSYEEAARLAFGTDLKTLDMGLATYAHQFRLPALALSGKFAQSTMAEAAEPLTEQDASAVQGELLANAGAPKDAEEFLAKALAIEPAHRVARIALARVRIQQERYDDAIAQLQGVVRDDDTSFAAHFYLAAAFAAADRLPESLAEYTHATALNDRSAPAWFGVSSTAMALARDSQSQDALAHVTRLDSRPGWHRTLAQFALQRGRNDVAAREVRTYLEKAGAADESGQYAAFIGAIAHWRLGQPQEADALLARAAEAAPAHSWVATVTTYLQGGVGDGEFLGRAKDNGQRTEAHTYVGVKAALAGRLDEARAQFAWVKEHGDRNYTEYPLAVAELKRLDARR
jgi:tetratricopeptide (TPR) repeat protein